MCFSDSIVTEAFHCCRKAGAYFRKKKEKDGTVSLTKCKFKETATVHSLKLLRLKGALMGTCNSRFHQRLRGGAAQAILVSQGATLKRSREAGVPLLEQAMTESKMTKREAKNKKEAE